MLQWSNDAYHWLLRHRCLNNGILCTKSMLGTLTGLHVVSAHTTTQRLFWWRGSVIWVRASIILYFLLEIMLYRNTRRCSQLGLRQFQPGRSSVIPGVVVICSGWWWNFRRDHDKDGNACPNAWFSWNDPMRLAADIIGGQPTTILRDGMPGQVLPWYI